MIKSANLTLQARTVQAVNVNGTKVMATVFGAFAMKTPSSQNVVVSMNADLSGTF